MLSNDFIDLLSSDEEVVTAPSSQKPPLKPATTPVEKCAVPRLEQSLEKKNLPCFSRVDRAIQLDEGHNIQSAKRRKTSHSLLTNKENDWGHDGFAVLDDDDPIVFASSAQPHAKALDPCWQSNTVGDLDISSDEFDDSLPEDILGLRRQATKGYLGKGTASHGGKPGIWSSHSGSSGLSDTTKALLASLTNEDGNGRQAPKSLAKITSVASEDGPPLKIASGDHDALAISEQEGSDQGRIEKLERRHRLTTEEKAQRVEAKDRDKEAKKRDKEREKERKANVKQADLERKRREKEEKAMQKRKDAEIAEVNKAKLDKKDSTSEMIVDLPASIHGQKLDTQTREFLKNLDVEVSLYQSSVPNIVKFRRKVKARWNLDEGLWEPLPQMHVEDEKHIICIMPAEEFICMAMNRNDKEGIDDHVTKLRNAHRDCVLIYLIEGLTKRMRESKTAANRKYQEEVLNQGQTESTNGSQTSKRRKAAAAPVIVDDDIIEDALLRLQVMNDCLIHHTASYIETAEWIATFTQHISTIPYKLSLPPFYPFSNFSTATTNTC